MSYTLHQLPVFEAEVRSAADHYTVDAPEVLDTLLAQLDETIERIRRFPTIPRVVRGETRAVHLGENLPYSVLYVVQDHLDQIVLTAFLHDRRDRQRLLPRFTWG